LKTKKKKDKKKETSGIPRSVITADYNQGGRHLSFTSRQSPQLSSLYSIVVKHANYPPLISRTCVDVDLMTALLVLIPGTSQPRDHDTPTWQLTQQKYQIRNNNLCPEKLK
jgi:hypothetical protein